MNDQKAAAVQAAGREWGNKLQGEFCKNAGRVQAPFTQKTYRFLPRARALALADNKVAENARWDHERLAIEFAELSQFLIEENLEISSTGFDTSGRLLAFGGSADAAPGYANISRYRLHSMSESPVRLSLRRSHCAAPCDKRLEFSFSYRAGEF
jgi:hypothetical protein